MVLAELEYRLDGSILTQRMLHLRIGARDVNAAMDRIALRLQKKTAVPGFRPGRAPLTMVRKYCSQRIADEAIGQLWRAALDQVIQQLKEADRPFLPPELLDRGKLRLRYNEPFEAALRYLVDPSGIGRNPEQTQGRFDPLASLHPQRATDRPVGVPAIPGPPASSVGAAPSLPELPRLPDSKLPQAPSSGPQVPNPRKEG